MNLAALLTSAGINIALCVVLFSLYSILRKQPSNANVYFGRRLASRRRIRLDLGLERFVPSPSWILKAWETTEDELVAIGGLDAVVFVRILVFSIRVFSVAAIICAVLVLPVNYYGQEMEHKKIPLESLEVFTIENVKEGSKWYGYLKFKSVILVQIASRIFKRMKKTVEPIGLLVLRIKSALEKKNEAV